MDFGIVSLGVGLGSAILATYIFLFEALYREKLKYSDLNRLHIAEVILLSIAAPTMIYHLVVAVQWAWQLSL